MTPCKGLAQNLRFLLPFCVAVITHTLHLQFYKMVIILFTNFKCTGLVGFRKTLTTYWLLYLACQPQEIFLT